VRAAITWLLITSGLTLFVLARLGAATGAITIPFDQHHVLGQIAGIVLLLAGLMRLR